MSTIADTPAAVKSLSEGPPSLLDSTPPQNMEAEMSVVGAMLLDSEACAVGLRELVASDFYRGEHRAIFGILGGMHARGEGVDLTTLGETLRAAGKLEEIGGAEYLITLADSVPTIGNIGYYATIVKEKALLRNLINTAAEIMRTAHTPRGSADAVLHKAEAALTDLRARRNEKARPKSLRALLADHPTLRPPVIHGLLRQGETMNAIAPSKVGKSWLVTDLALAVATGRPWLDTFETEASEVLVLDNELHRETITHRIPKVAEAREIPLPDVADRLFVEPLRGRLMDLYRARDYFEALEPGRFKVIILDAWYRFWPPKTDENDNAIMAGLYNILDNIAGRLGCCFVLVHHASKGNQSGKGVTDVGAGAGAQSRAADTHLILRPHETDGAYVLEAGVRNWKPVAPFCLRWEFPVWNPAPDLDPAKLRFESLRGRRQPKEPEAPTKVWTAEDFVAAFITATPKPRASIIEAATADGLSAKRATTLLGAAEGDGKIHRWDYGRNVPVKFATTPQPDPERTA